MTKRKIERLLDLLGELSEDSSMDGRERDMIGELRTKLWDMLEAR